MLIVDSLKILFITMKALKLHKHCIRNRTMIVQHMYIRNWGTCARRVSGIIRYAQDRNIGRPNIFFSNKTKGPKEDSQYCLRSPMPGGGEP